MDKLIFNKPRHRLIAPDKAPVIRVSAEAYNCIGEIVEETGLSVQYVASQMIKYAAEHTEIIEQ